MHAITQRDAVSAIESLKNMKARMAKKAQSAEEGISAAFTTGSIVVVGGGAAWLNERFGDQNADLGGSMREILIPGTKAPADLMAGILAHGAAFMLGASFKHAEHVHNAASALIGGWAIRNGMAMGAEARASAGKTASGWSPRTGRPQDVSRSA
jgi:hypothetical protein